MELSSEELQAPDDFSKQILSANKLSDSDVEFSEEIETLLSFKDADVFRKVPFLIF